MGVGVENDSTFSGIINADQAWNVLNPSLLGWTTSNYLNVVETLFKEKKNKHNIAEVYIFWCLNDVYEVNPPLLRLDVKKGGMADQLLIFTSRNFKLHQFIRKIALDRPTQQFLQEKQLLPSR